MKMSRFLVVGVVLVVASCEQLMSSKIEIRNDAMVPAEKIEIAIGGGVINIGRVDPKGAATAKFSPKKDSDVRMTYQLGRNLNSFSCVGDVYVTTGIRVHIVVTIDAGGGCRVSSV